MKNKLINFLEFIKQKNPDKPSKRIKYMMIIGLAALLLLVVSNLFAPAQEESSSFEPASESLEEPPAETVSSKSTATDDVDEIESSYEKDLQDMINKIQGVSDAEVMVNLESTKVKVYEKNLITGQQSTTETDKNGGTREIEDSSRESKVVLVRQGDKEVPLLIQTKKPDVKGVFVVAKGVDHATVKQWVVQSISRVLDVPTYRVSVMPKN